jgi:tRNA nucleotidyltransferase/poly(A) polymerase
LKFSSKFNFEISNEIHNNIFLNKDKYNQLIYSKIPKERIQKEFENIFKNPNPHIVIYSLYKYELLSSFLHLDLFRNPNHLIQDKDLIYIVNLFLVENYLIENFKDKFNNQFYNNNFYVELYSTLLILIFRNFTNDSNILLSKLLLSHLFGQNVSLWKISHNLIINFDEFTELKDQNLSRLKIGIYLRKIKGNNLIKMIFISLSNEYVEKFSNNKILNEINKEKLDELFKKYYEIYEFVDKENLFKIDELKPILNGKDILNYFPKTENKQMKFLINSLIEEQIKTKNTLSRNEAIEILKNKINKSNKNKFIIL